MTRPNILFILADYTGYGDLSASNGGLSHAPPLDALMRNSVRPTQHYAASPACDSSHTALLEQRAFG